MIAEAGSSVSDKGIESKLDSLKLLVALLYAEDAKGKKAIKGLTRIEKLIFLAQKEGLKHEFYRYVPSDYGPWSSEIHDYIETLKLRGLVHTSSESLRVPADEADLDECLRNEDMEGIAIPPREVEIYQLSEAGMRAAKVLWTHLSDKERKAISETKRRFNNESLFELMRYVFTNYETYAKNSRIRDKIMRTESSFGSRPKLDYRGRNQE